METSPKGSEMSDVTMARSLVQETWPERPGRPIKSCIAAIFDALKRVERGLPREVARERPRAWTERRVRAIWHGEARRIDNYEMADLERAAVEEARHAYRESIERAARLAAFLEHQDEDFHEPQASAFASAAREMAVTGNGRAIAGTGPDRARADHGSERAGRLAGTGVKRPERQLTDTDNDF